MSKRWTLALAIAGFVITVLMSITLLVLWNIYIIRDYTVLRDAAIDQAIPTPRIRWAILAIGTTFFTIIIAALSLFFAAYLLHRKYRRQQIDWVNMTSHELKLPVANIKLFTQTLQRPEMPAADRERFLGLILQESARLEGLVNRILQARRMGSGQEEFTPEPIEISEWLWEHHERHHIRFTLASEAKGRVLGDRKLLDQVMDNLLHNAVKYGDGTPPSVRLVRRGKSFLVEVADLGIGIPAEYHQKVFDFFYRTPLTEHRRRTGTGLGLYIARKAIALHRGEIGIRDNPAGRGTIFWFRLPEAP